MRCSVGRAYVTPSRSRTTRPSAPTVSPPSSISRRRPGSSRSSASRSACSDRRVSSPATSSRSSRRSTYASTAAEAGEPLHVVDRDEQTAARSENAKGTEDRRSDHARVEWAVAAAPRAGA